MTHDGRRTTNDQGPMTKDQGPRTRRRIDRDGVMDNQTLVMLCSFGAAASLGYFVTRMLMGDESDKLRDRLGAQGPDAPAAAPRRTVKNLLESVGGAAA